MSLIQINDHSFFSNGMNRETRILDLGANRGRFARGVIQAFGCRCVCVEPAPALCAALRSVPGVEVINVAVAQQAGRMLFHISKNSEASSLLIVESEATRRVDSLEVEAITLRECLARTQWIAADLVKIDIEGAEIGVLDSCSDEFLLTIPQFTIEFHDFCGITPPSEVERVARRLQSLGFGMIGMWREYHGDVVFLQRKKAGVGLFEFLMAKYWLRNWWGLRRVLRRLVSKGSHA